MINLVMTKPMRYTADRMERVMSEKKPALTYAHWVIVVMKGSFGPGCKAATWGRTYRDVYLALVDDKGSIYDKKAHIAYEGRFTVHFGKTDIPSPNSEYTRVVHKLETIAGERNHILNARRAKWQKNAY